MVALVSGGGLGLTTTSPAKLGNAGEVGIAATGSNGEGVYINTTTGNLVIQEQDEMLDAVGLDLNLTRTYNSQGVLFGDNGDNWTLSVDEQLLGLTGTVNTAGSTITKVFGDGSEAVYQYNATGMYVNTNNSGAYDTLSYNSTAAQWTWTDGTTQDTETYNSSGQLLISQDTAGNKETYTYTGSLLTQITDASGQTTFLDYTGNNLTDIRVVSQGVTETRTRYTYDSSNRLTTVWAGRTRIKSSSIGRGTFLVYRSWAGRLSNECNNRECRGNQSAANRIAD
jgi:hypothetical protein